MQARVIGLRAYRHGGRSEVLYLFQVEIELLGAAGKQCHIGFRTTRMARYEVWYQLLVKTGLSVYGIKDFFKAMKKAERWLAHKIEHMLFSMFGRYFKASADVVFYKFAKIIAVAFLHGRVRIGCHGKVVAYAAAYEAFLYSRHCRRMTIELEQRTVVVVKVCAGLGVQAGGTAAL